MNLRFLVGTCCLLLVVSCAPAPASGGNRFTHLDSDDPFYVGRDFPRLITPQWIGEEGVDAVVILSIDDLRETPKYETYLRPILERLKQIDGRAPVSIMVNSIGPTNAQLQSWLKEGLSLECHTLAHPCPLCQKGDFAAAAQTYHGCVDLLNSIPGNQPVAFRMPCCDSMNSPTPRFYAEIFNRRTASGHFLTIDSSVMVIPTTNDTTLPRHLVLDDDGRERFRKYLPAETNATTRVSMGSFTTTIEDYPYPYVIGKLAWEFPCIVPSDWEANNLHQPNNPRTVEDWKRALDAIVLKQGVFTLVFHPHGWIRSGQVIELIDYAEATYGKRVKFLNFREADERLKKHLLAGASLRAPDGTDNGIRLFDVNDDGLLDVAIGGAAPANVKRQLRVWDSNARRWMARELPEDFMRAGGTTASWNVQLGVVNRQPIAIATGAKTAWRFSGDRWIEDKSLVAGLETIDRARPAARPDSGMRLRDIDNDGQCELFVANAAQNLAFKWDGADRKWKPLGFTLPGGTRFVDEHGRDAGLRFVDVDGDGFDDVLFSDGKTFSLHLFRKDSRKLRLDPGWTDEVVAGRRADPLTDAIPPVVREGTNRNNGVWFQRGTMWIQNEDTAHLPDRVDRRTFQQLLSGSMPRALSPEESLKAMKPRPGFRIELVASEPLIADPVAFEWGADGRLWVVEMGDYPSGLDGKGKSGGRVRVLEDVDGDGRYDKATTFLEGVNFPTGIQPWRDGALVSAAPEIFYAEDSDGDGKADRREPLFTGFTEGNQQHRVNGFEYGLDGWLYVANGDSGGNVIAAGPQPAGLRPIALRGQDLRIHADKRLVEAIAGQTQFGRRRDDWGNWFGNNNPTWLWHYYFPEHYLARNPLLPLKSTKKVLANYENSTRCFPISRMMSRFNDPFAANHVTSANSAAPYRDDLFGPEFQTSVFISEPVHNLVHREVLHADGVTFTSRRAPDEKEIDFLVSADNWFRPALLKTGPDGALYIADMYRLVIEHPEWIPPEMQQRYDLRAGSDMGRIYRVYPEHAAPRRIPRLDKLDSAGLVAAMDSPSGWQRDTAQRLLAERGAPASRVAHLAIESASPKVRVQALNTLSVLGSVPAGIVAAALNDADEHVREHAVSVGEALLRNGVAATRHHVTARDSWPGIATLYRVSSAALARVNAPAGTTLRPDDTLVIPAAEEAFISALLARTNDPAVRVRFQLAFTLGEWNDPRAAAALVALARDGDENVRNAVLSSAPRHAAAMIARLNALPASDAARALRPHLQKLIDSPHLLRAKSTVIERTNTLSSAQREERANAVAQYAGVARLKGNAANGAELFQQQCAQCHRFKGSGTEVGPDLGMMAGKPVEQLVVAIIDPNAAVESRYQNYSVVTRDEREFSGIIVAETPTTLTLRAANRPDETLLRADLKELTASGVSLMPDGLEHAFNPQQLADLIAYLAGP